MGSFFLQSFFKGAIPLLLCVITVCFVWFGCQNISENSTSNPRIFRYNQVNPIQNLDPAFAKSQNHIWAVGHLYDGLVQLDSALQVVPNLATSWSVSPDGLVYRFRIRDSVFFHDDPCFSNGQGRQLVASDVQYSLLRLMSDSLLSPGSWIFDGLVDPKSGITTLGDSVITISLLKPFPAFLGLLANAYCMVVPKEAVDYYKADFRVHPVGTGPYRMVRFEEGQALFLRKNEQYWDRTIPHSFDGIKIGFIPDRLIAMMELQAGKLDFVSGIESSFLPEFVTKEGTLAEKYQGKIQMYKSPYLNFEYIGLHLDEAHPILKDARLRQALNYSINREEMLSVLRRNIGRPASEGVVPFGLPSHQSEDVQGYRFDLRKADSLLRVSGFPQGKGLPTFTIHTNAEYADLLSYIVKQWEQVGISCKIELMETAVLREAMVKGSLSGFRASWIADYPDGESFLCMFYSKNPAPPNYTHYRNAKFDELYEKSLSVNTIEERYALYAEMDRILIADAPVIFLFYDESVCFTNPNIKSIYQNGLNMLKPERFRVVD